MRPELRQISQRMSLRKPQIEALEVFAEAIERLPMKLGVDLQETLKALKEKYSHVADFERNFPNLCFALATGVGKTRLLGAMIAYLSTVHGIRDFVVLAPNNTILEKLVREFSNPIDPKYVFRGIAEFATQAPRVITSENYDEGYGVRNRWARQLEFFKGDEVHINIFNIAMIHSDKRRMKSPRETIEGGLSYFEYLAQLERLVVFMDEAHRYRATSGAKAINELNPILGVELTATPRIEITGGSVAFKNIIYEYPLSSALKDGYVKEPWVAGRENYQPDQFSAEDLERLKLEDGVRIHEATKVHLQNYAYMRGQPLIKPFVLVITENMAHANRIEHFIKNEDFFDGKYAQKVRVVHSDVKSKEGGEERMIKDLLEIELPHSTIEIVIHVNMLKEGWDVRNLYTIIPLRAANSKTLIEQSLGRGLRLPYGERTGIIEVDRLTIVSHDRFDEIVKEASKPDSLIKSGFLIGRDLPISGIRGIASKPLILQEIDCMDASSRQIMERTLEIHEEQDDKEKTIKLIVEEYGEEGKEAAKIVLERYEALTIQIPRIHIEPVEIKPGKYQSFTLDLRSISLLPMVQSLIEQNLQNGVRRKIHVGNSVKIDCPLEEYVANALLDRDEVTEENVQIAEDLGKQLVTHLRSYFSSEEDVQNVLINHKPTLVENLYSQMQKHFEPPEFRFSSRTGRGFTFIKPFNYVASEVLPYNAVIENKTRVPEYIYEGFKKSQFDRVKFDSDSEKTFAQILEQDLDVQKWLRPPKHSLHLFYHSDKQQYVPDFIVETHQGLFLCEIKSSSELDDPIVKQKAKAALLWCELATQHAKEHNAKTWKYLLIPHNEVRLTSSFQGFVDRFTFGVMN